MGRRPAERTTDDKTLSIENVKNSIKRNAPERDRVLTVRDGQKKYVLPIKARMIASDGYLYISIPATTEILRTSGRDAEMIGPDEDGKEALAALSVAPKRRGGRRRAGTPEVPAELMNMIPAGYKLVHGADGSPRFAKIRGARKSKA